MPNYRQIMDTQVKPSDGHKILWVRDDSESRARYSLLGARPIRLSKAERTDPDKRRSRVGELYVDAEGMVKLGDAVAWEIPIEKSEQITREAQEKHNAMLHDSAMGARVAEHLAATPVFKMRTSGDIPNDAAPKNFGKPDKE